MFKGVMSKLVACAIMVCFLAVSSAFAGQATMTSPANGSKLGQAPVFTWAKNGQQAGWLYFGTTPGAYNLGSFSTDNNSSQTVTGLPADNSTIYVTLWSKNAGVWANPITYSYIARSPGSAYDGAVMTTPAANGATLKKSFAFSWTAVTGATRYWLDCGTSLGAYNLYSKDAGTATTATVNNLPTAGTTVYVRLYTRCGGSLSYQDYNYNSAALATITSPSNGARLAKPAAFTWTDVNADEYWIYIGSTVGAYNYYSQSMGTSLTAPKVPGLPTDNSTVYVRLWTRNGSSWAYNDTSYIAQGTGVTDLARITTPANTTDNLTAYKTFVWDNATKTGATNYWFDIGTGSYGATNIGSYNMYTANSKGVLLASYPSQDIYVRLWTRMGLFIKYIDYKFHRGG